MDYRQAALRERFAPNSECKLCAGRFFSETDYHVMGLCSMCARQAGAAWVYAHSGESDPALDTEGRYRKPEPPRGYRKVTIPEPLRWEVFERDGHACKRCGSRRMLRADHIIPESKGGPTTIENLQTLCQRCNCKKGRY